LHIQTLGILYWAQSGTPVSDPPHSVFCLSLYPIDDYLIATVISVPIGMLVQQYLSEVASERVNAVVNR